jgi:hypothetical protein
MTHFFSRFAINTRRVARNGRIPAEMALLLVLAAWAFLFLTGASDPDVLRVRVPAADVGRWFPTGTDVRVMPPSDFESLVRAAARGSSLRQRGEPPHLIRAHHSARFGSGVLSGRSEFVFEPSKIGPADYVLEPWNPAILPSADAKKVLGARATGEPSLWVDETPNKSYVLEWELRPRKYAHGRGMVLLLPGNETTVLSLEVPGDWVPTSRRGIRRGPRPAPGGENSLWEIESESGQIDLHLYQASDQGDSSVDAASWLTSTTQIDLRESASRSAGLANWVTVCSIELDHRNPRPLDVELDPGLELIDIEGSSVRGYHTRQPAPGAPLEVTLDLESETSATVRFLAHAQVPAEGPWKIPAMRPLNARWTGGKTEVILDAFRVLEECRETSGRRVFPSRIEAGAGDRLVFEAVFPRSVAELVFGGPRGDASCEIRGQLFMGSAPDRLECQLKWVALERPISELQIDPGAAWLPDRVLVRGLDEPPAWHLSRLPSGNNKLHVALPAAARSQKELVLVVGANSTLQSVRGPLDLPRVRPLGASVADEAWLALVDPETMVRPTFARGLAWIDPALVPGLRFNAGAGREYREALAWRWLDGQATARVYRQPIGQEPRATIRTVARIDDARQRLSLDGSLALSFGAASVDSVPVWVNETEAALRSWRFRDAALGTELSLRPLDDAARARYGFPKDGFAGSLACNGAPGTDKTISFHRELAWKNHGTIPLLAVPRKYLSRGVIEVEMPPGMQSRLETFGLSRLDASSLLAAERDLDLESDEGGAAEPAPGHEGVVHALVYREPGARLELFTEQLANSQASGVIREAALTTRIDPGGRYLNRLRLLVSSGTARQLDLLMPDELTLVRVRRDGFDLPPLRSGSGISIPLHAASPGPRSSTVVVDYESARVGIAEGSRLRPALPEIGMPCLSFVWEVLTPPGWAAVDCGKELVAHDREDGSCWPFAALGLWMPWNGLTWGEDARYDANLYSALNNLLLAPPSDELTFAEWFSRWDSGALPVVVDRLALHSAGLGPRSQCVPSRVGADLGNVSLTTLHRHGLALVRIGNVLVITTDAEARERGLPDRWSLAAAEALIWGSDRADRFQTLARWRAEASPKASSAGADESVERIKLLPGWLKWRLSCATWPGGDSYVYLVDRRARALGGWVIVSLYLLILLSFRGLLARRSGIVLGSVLLGTFVLYLVLPSRFASFAAAGFAGTLLVICLQLAYNMWRPSAGDFRLRRRTESSLLRRLGGASATGLVVALLLGKLVLAQSSSLPGLSSAIVALFPYEGAFDPAHTADRVILRLADYQRLVRLSQSSEPAPMSSVRAISALHRIARQDAKTVVVESEFELLAAGRAPFTWEMPVSSTRDIVVTLDGKSLPISVLPGGSRARMVIPHAGSSLVRMRRFASTKTDDRFEVLSLPINAMPSARAIIEPSRDGQHAGELSALGSTELEPDGTLTGRLGPADKIEVRWPARDSAPQARAERNLEGLILWDIDPAGDRVRARFTLLQTPKLSSIHFAHEPGLVLRSVSVTGPTTAFWEENAAKGEWVVQVDPPLSAGATISLDCWKPLSSPAVAGAGAGALANAPKAGALAGVSSRRIPRLYPIGWDRYAGSLGVRRPGQWTGRLESFPIPDMLGDEAFVRSWGNLPDELLTLCGTRRFERECMASLRTGPIPTKIQLKPAVTLQIESGRMVMTLEADVAQPSGNLQQTELRLPENIENVQVSALGLRNWVLSADRRLKLLFDDSAKALRRLRISGWIPLKDDPLDVGSRAHRAPTPWIWGPDVATSGGFLTITSMTEPEIQGATGLTSISSEYSSAAGAAAPKYRLTYRVDDSGELGEILCPPIPPRVSVAIESQMTIFPESADWVAVLRYDVVGGALEAIHFRLPAAWAAQAQLLLSGSEYQLTTETRGQTAFWTITPERPLWGSQRFVLRSTLSPPADRVVNYPEITPLGQGSVDAYVGIVNATGRPISTENVVGLQKIPFETRFKTKEFAQGLGSPVAAFRVGLKSWSLGARLARNLPEVNHARNGGARVELADLTVTVLPDRSSMGRAIYETVAESGRNLSFELPPLSELLWTTVDSNPVIPLQSSAGVWSILLDEGRQSRVSVIWRTAAPEERSGGSMSAPALPQAGAGPTTSLVTLYTSASLSIQGSPAGLESATASQLELARADAFARSLRDFLSKMDRSFGRDHEKLVSLLINQELALRSALRSAAWGDRQGTSARIDRAQREAAVTRAARNDSIEMVRKAGLDDDLASAQRYFGQASGSANRAVTAVAEPSASERVRFFGRPSTWIGVLPGSGEPAPRGEFRFVSRPWEAIWDQTRDATFLVPLVLAGAALFGLACSRHYWPSALALFITVALAGVVGGPLVLAGGLGLVAAGRTRRVVSVAGNP